MKISKQMRFTRMQGQDGQKKAIATELDRHGGANARNWRKKIAQLASNKAKQLTKTLSFPLDLDVPLQHFDAFDEHYNAIEGTNEASLYGILIRTHLCGLSVYTSKNAAKAEREIDRFPDQEFHRAAEKFLGMQIPNLFTPSKLLVLFQSMPKNSKEKGPIPFSEAELINRIHKNVYKKSVSEKTDDRVKALFSICAKIIIQNSNSYKELADKSESILMLLGRELKKKFSGFPSIESEDVTQSDCEFPFSYTGFVLPLSNEEEKPVNEAYWIYHIITCLLLSKPGSSAKEIKELLLSPNDNALSNLYGPQLWSAKAEGLFRTSSSAELSKKLGIPEGRCRDVERLIKATRSLKHPSLFGKHNYADYRKIIAGKLKSWVSNYLKRLEELEKQIDALGKISLPSDMASICEILDGLKITQNELFAMHDVRQRSIQSAGECVLVLLGKNRTNRPIGAAKELEKHLQKIEDIHGTLRMILNQINQRLSDEPDAGLEIWKKAFSVAENVELFRLPHISGGAPDVNLTLEDINKSLKYHYRCWNSFSEWVIQNAAFNFQHCLTHLAAQEALRAGNRTGFDFAILAEQKFLHQLERLSRRVSKSEQEKILSWITPLISATGNPKSKSIINRLKHNAMGSFYRSPWSSSRHQSLPYCRTEFAKFDWLLALRSLSQDIECRVQKSPTASNFQDHLEIKRALTSFLIMGLPAKTSRSNLLEVLALDDLEPHDRLRIALEKSFLTQEDLSSLFSWLSSLIAKMRFFVRREHFIVRHKFSAIKQDMLIYSAKDIESSWNMPDRYLSKGHSIGNFLSEHASIFPANGAIPVQSIFQKLLHFSPDSGHVHFLSQLPHDWFAPLPFNLGIGQHVEGLKIDKDCSDKPDKKLPVIKTLAARLIGPSSYKQQLTDILIGRKKIAEWMLILDWQHESQLAWGDSGPHIQAKLLRCIPRLALPLSDVGNQDSDNRLRFFDRLIAIDLGEMQIGYSVFDIPSALRHLSEISDSESEWSLVKPMIDPQLGIPLTGVIQVKGVRALMRAVKTHRSGQASNSKLRQNFDTKLQQLRESVCSEVLQKIDSLCKRYKAFPVLESNLVNFQTGSRQLDLVYGDVVRHYSFSKVDAHIKMRSEYWMGGEQWIHPYLVQRKVDEMTGKRTGEAKPLSLFPGASVAASGTSQTCVQCGRNPVSTLKGLENKGETSFQVNEAGEIGLPNGAIRLFTGLLYDENSLYVAARNKINLALNKPLSPGNYSVADIKRYLRMSLRQKHPNARSGASSQGWYCCVYSSCHSNDGRKGSGYHADLGAAINIGRKFLATSIDVKLSLAKLAQQNH